MAEFKGNAALVKTDAFRDTEAEAIFKKGWRENLTRWNKVGSDYAYQFDPVNEQALFKVFRNFQ